jgi:hypothetical protein
MGKNIPLQRKIAKYDLIILGLIMFFKWLTIQVYEPTLTADYESLKYTLLSFGFGFLTLEDGTVVFDRFESYKFETYAIVLNVLLLYYYNQ